VTVETARPEHPAGEPAAPEPAPPIPLVLIHGAGAVGQIWQNQLLAFPRAVAPDLPGHPTGAGLSTVPDMAGWMGEFIARHGLDRCVLGGYSVGGAVAIEAALAAPDRYRGLILVATGARLRVRQEFFDQLSSDYDAAVEELLRWWFSPDASPRVVERARAALRMVSPAVVHDDFWAAHQFDAMGRVGGIRIPTLIICGEEDRLTPVKYSEYLHEQIPGSHLVVIPHAAHLVVLEAPRATNEAIAAFLRTLS